jgi:CheY-like chemotaxis protein
VLLDCEMSGLDGYATCRRLREREGEGRHTVVVAVTAHAQAGERERCLAAGMDDYLTKPFRGEELAAVLDRWLAIDRSPSHSAARLAARLAALDRLGEATGEPMRERVDAAFLDQASRDFATMLRALVHRDGESLAAAAHALGGSAGMLGAVELAARCAELETLARRQDLAACGSRLAAVEQAYRAVAERLSA